MVDRRKVNSADEVPKESDRQFLERSGVGSMMRDVLGKIISNRPENPIAFLADYFDSVEDQSSLVHRANQVLKMTHYSRPLFESNVRSAYNILSKHKINKKLHGVNGAVYTDLIVALCRDMPEAVVNKLLQKIESSTHEAVPFDVFKSGVFTCCVFQDYVKLAENLFQSLDIQRIGKANKSLCEVVVEQLNTALGSSRTDPRRILESGYNLGVDGLYLALERTVFFGSLPTKGGWGIIFSYVADFGAVSRSQRNAALQTKEQFVVELSDAFLSKVKKFS